MSITEIVFVAIGCAHVAGRLARTWVVLRERSRVRELGPGDVVRFDPSARPTASPDDRRSFTQSRVRRLLQRCRGRRDHRE